MAGTVKVGKKGLVDRGGGGGGVGCCDPCGLFTCVGTNGGGKFNGIPDELRTFTPWSPPLLTDPRVYCLGGKDGGVIDDDDDVDCLGGGGLGGGGLTVVSLVDVGCGEG